MSSAVGRCEGSIAIIVLMAWAYARPVIRQWAAACRVGDRAVNLTASRIIGVIPCGPVSGPRPVQGCAEHVDLRGGGEEDVVVVSGAEDLGRDLGCGDVRQSTAVAHAWQESIVRALGKPVVEQLRGASWRAQNRGGLQVGVSPTHLVQPPHGECGLACRVDRGRALVRAVALPDTGPHLVDRRRVRPATDKPRTRRVAPLSTKSTSPTRRRTTISRMTSTSAGKWAYRSASARPSVSVSLHSGRWHRSCIGVASVTSKGSVISFGSMRRRPSDLREGWCRNSTVSVRNVLRVRRACGQLGQ